MKKLLTCCSLAAVPLAMSAYPPTSFDTEREVASFMPAGTVLYVEAPGASAFFEEGLDHPLVVRLLESPIGQFARAELPMTPDDALALADLYLGRSVLDTASSLTSKGIAFGIVPKRGKPAAAFVARGDDAELWEEVVQTALAKVAENLQLPASKIATPHAIIRDVKVWYLGDDFTMALKDGVFLASNDEGVVRDMIDLGAADDPETSGLMSNDRFRGALAHMDSRAFLWSWADLDSIGEAYANSLTDLRKTSGNPGAQFLLGAVLSNLGMAREATAELIVLGDRVEVNVTGLHVEAGIANEVLPPLEAEAPRMPSRIAGEGARAMLYRDIEGLFRHRADLFPVGVQPKFAEATSGLSLFFGGADVTDEVLPNLSPWIGLVVRDPRFSEGATPDVPLPGAAIITRMTDTEAMGEKFVGAFQTAIGLINIDGAQKMRPPMTVRIELVGDAQMTSARFPTPKTDEGVDIRYNLEPACALVGDAFIIGTHASVVRGVVEQLQRGDYASESAAGDVLTIRGDTVARTVRANEEALVMNAVLNEGKSTEQAKQEIGALALIADMIDNVAITADRMSELDLKFSFSLDLAGGGK